MPDAPPNPVYQTTLQGLSALVSGAAASRLLDKSLADAGLTPARVRPVQMKELLAGPVLDELQAILPRSGLLRNLEAITADIDAMAAEAMPQPAIPGESMLQPAIPAARSATVRQASADVARARTAQVITGVRTELTRQQVNSAERLQSAVLTLAAIDNVTMVAAVRSSGQTEFSRGAGDIRTLSRFGMLALSLLTRSGSLKMFFLALEDSSLLLFPWGSDALLLVGRPQLNVGAVVTAFNDIVLSKEEK